MAEPQMTMAAPPTWALSALACPTCRRPLAFRGADFLCTEHRKVGRWDSGIARFGVKEDDPQIASYLSKGGAHFQERMRIPFTMTNLDSPLYHGYLSALRPRDRSAFVVDVGAGDGRNTLPWIEWGYERIIATDPVPTALGRLQSAIAHTGAAALHRVLLVQGDARFLPLASGFASLAIAVEALCCLLEDYSIGMRECARILAPAGQLLVSERSWEGGLVSSLFYSGIEGMLHTARTRCLVEGESPNVIESSVFERERLIEEVRSAGLVPQQQGGIPLLSIAMGYLRGQGVIPAADEARLPEVIEVLERLGRSGDARRAHVVVAQKPDAGAGAVQT